MALLASTLKNNVANAETQAQSINPSHDHESNGERQFVPSLHPFTPFLLCTPQPLCLDCYIIEQYVLFSFEVREREREKRREMEGGVSQCEIVSSLYFLEWSWVLSLDRSQNVLYPEFIISFIKGITFCEMPVCSILVCGENSFASHAFNTLLKDPKI